MKTEIKNSNGRPTLFIDGKPHHGFLGSSPAPYMNNLLDAGFDVVDTHPQTPLGWIGPDQYDYAATDARIESYLQQSKNAGLIVRFWLGYPGEAWWSSLHPEEGIAPLPVDETQPMPWDGLTNPLPWIQLVAAHNGSSTASKPPVFQAKPSFASLRFREEAGEALRRAVAHVEEKYGDSIIGYVTGGGPCGEWFHWYADQPGMMDYSVVMRRAFQTFLQKRYGDISALNGAWRSSYAAFTTVDIPTSEQRFRPTHGNLRSASLERDMLDFYDAYHREVSDTLLYWAAKTKEGCDREKVVMVFHGYLWNHNYGDAQARSGHAHLEAVLKSRDVDVIVAPFCYSRRQMDGVFTGQSVAASVLNHGKLYIHELDGSTSLKSCWNCPDHHNPQTSEETGELFRRELNKMLCEGSAGWYMDLAGGYYNSPEVVAELHRTIETGACLRPGTRRPDAQVAVVLDPKASFYFREGEPLLSPLIDAFKQYELAQMGLGFDDLTLDDLENLSPEETARYKFWIFPCAVHLTDRNLEAIRAHACRNGNHVLWNYAVNVCGADSLDLSGMELATGFRCGVEMEPGELSVTVPPSAHPWTAGLEHNIAYGTYGDMSPDDIKYHAVLGLYATNKQGFRISPRFFIQQGGDALGSINDLPGHPTGLAVRAMEGWVSILSCAPLIPRRLLHSIAQSAGCHVYTEFPAQVVQCEGRVGLFFLGDGPCVIHLPGKAGQVIERYSGKVVGSDCCEVTLSAQKNHAILLEFE